MYDIKGYLTIMALFCCFGCIRARHLICFCTLTPFVISEGKLACSTHIFPFDMPPPAPKAPKIPERSEVFLGLGHGGRPSTGAPRLWTGVGEGCDDRLDGPSGIGVLETSAGCFGVPVAAGPYKIGWAVSFCCSRGVKRRRATSRPKGPENTGAQRGVFGFGSRREA